jgi:hypothetical protein
LENFLYLFEEATLRTGPPRDPLTFGGKPAENLLGFGQVMFGPRFVACLLNAQCGGFTHDFILIARPFCSMPISGKFSCSPDWVAGCWRG